MVISVGLTEERCMAVLVMMVVKSKPAFGATFNLTRVDPLTAYRPGVVCVEARMTDGDKRAMPTVCRISRSRVGRMIKREDSSKNIDTSDPLEDEGGARI